MGAWSFVDRRIEAVLAEIGMKAGGLCYAGRPEAAAPETSITGQRQRELADLLDDALDRRHGRTASRGKV